ncbi:MAG: acyl-CoA dehydrogenase family protein [Gammaproteobacteria bacterium]|nr:acyl-CoA dehydrogenase family protein [Gammaproteobacteria bacterium]
MSNTDLQTPAKELLNQILARAKTLTNNGKGIDDHQLLTRQVANLITRSEVATALTDYAAAHPANGQVATANTIFQAETAQKLRMEWEALPASLELAPEVIDQQIGSAERSTIRQGLAEANYRAIGEHLVELGAENNRPLADDSDENELLTEARNSARRFGREVVAPRAQEIHRQDLLVPEEIIGQMAELGFFGMSIPEAYGGIGFDNLTMILVTEELSAASLPAAGSLITRPEVLAKALLKGGTEAQKSRWLEPVAQGELMVAVAVTEPNTGSDVASVACRATPGEQNGIQGWFIEGAKAWCTFAGRANVLALLARTDPDPAAGHRGLSLFIVEKESFSGHDFEVTQSGGGKIVGQAIDTLGYRGMHSYVLQIDHYFVPAENLVGEEAGLGKGFYYQMAGFAAGRLQTAGRALGLAQSSLEAALEYTRQRPQFGQPLANYQNPRYQLGWMQTRLEAARCHTYAAARALDQGAPDAELQAAMAKLFACRMAVDVSQKAQLLHGGWGYAEEYNISRQVVDALVLPIFEGVEPILEMKVIGRGLLSS